MPKKMRHTSEKILRLELLPHYVTFCFSYYSVSQSFFGEE